MAGITKPNPTFLTIIVNVTLILKFTASRTWAPNYLFRNHETANKTFQNKRLTPKRTKHYLERYGKVMRDGGVTLLKRMHCGYSQKASVTPFKNNEFLGGNLLIFEKSNLLKGKIVFSKNDK